MKRILSIGLALLLWAGLPMQTDVQCLEPSQALAKAVLSAADREMKRAKSVRDSDIYNRAHKIIYSDGRVPNDPRTRIAVLINGDEQVMVEERVKNRIYSQLRKKFPREEFALMKGTDVKTKLLQMEEDRYFDSRPEVTESRGVYNDGYKTSTGESMTVRTDVDHMPIGIQPRGFADLRREDFVNVGREYGYDYLFVVSLNQGMVRREHHNYVLFGIKSSKGTMWVRVRLVDVASGDYAYRNDIAVHGLAHHGEGLLINDTNGMNGRLIEKAVNQAMTEAMNDIDINMH